MAEADRRTSASDWQVEIDSISAESWSIEIQNFDDATIYQSWAYGETSWGRKQLSHVVLKLGGDIVAMAQLRVIQVPLLGCGVAYVRWGPLWRKKDREADSAALSRILEALHKEYVRSRKLLLRVIPNVFTGDAIEPLLVSSFKQFGRARIVNQNPYRTFILDLSPSLEQLRKNLDGKWRNQLNRAEKNSLTILEGSDERLYSMFKSIYHEMMDRKTFDTTVDVDEFERIQNSLPGPQKMRTLVALKDAKPVSALIGSAIGETGIYLLGATSNEGMQHKGSYLLQWRMIQWLKERSCRFYDLGGINPEGNPGVYHFKSGFSGRDTTQIGQFERSGSWLSSLIVRLSERCQRRRFSSTRSATHRALPPLPIERPVAAKADHVNSTAHHDSAPALNH